jgi:ubiquinol-cytochrome c reductase subunit 7
MCLFRADDLIPEENDVVQLAIKRLPPKEAYDRIFRLRRAFQVSQHVIWLVNNVLT